MFEELYVRVMWYTRYKIQDTRYFIFQIRAPGGHDTTFIISTYTINKVKYNNVCFYMIMCVKCVVIINYVGFIVKGKPQSVEQLL